MAFCVILCLLLALLCLYLGVRLYGAERGLRSCAGQLRRRQACGSGTRLHLEAPNAAAEELLEAIDHLLALRQTEQADFRAREGALRRQISNVSHDLRTPLTSVLGYLQLLEGDALTAAERAEYLAVVKSRAQALQRLITSFYDLSRLDGDEYALDTEPVDLHRLLSDLLASFYGAFTEGGWTVEVDLQERLPPVLADEGAALRVLTNLIRNALEHGTGELSVSLCREGEGIATVFRNRAPQLAAEDIPHVFDRFYTADPVRTSGSTGLGLAIVKELSERMGCTVQAALEDGWFTVRVHWRSAE